MLKDKKLITVLAKVGITVTPDTIESLMLFSKRLDRNVSTLSEKMRSVQREVEHLQTLFEQTYDFFQ